MPVVDVNGIRQNVVFGDHLPVSALQHRLQFLFGVFIAFRQNNEFMHRAWNCVEITPGHLSNFFRNAGIEQCHRTQLKSVGGEDVHGIVVHCVTFFFQQILPFRIAIGECHQHRRIVFFGQHQRLINQFVRLILHLLHHRVGNPTLPGIHVFHNNLHAGEHGNARHHIPARHILQIFLISALAHHPRR